MNNDFNFDLAARELTSYRSSKETEAEMAVKYNLQNSWEVKQTYTNNGNKFRNFNLQSLEQKLAVQYGTRIPDAFTSTCNTQTCSTVENTPGFSLGVGRNYN